MDYVVLFSAFMISIGLGLIVLIYVLWRNKHVLEELDITWQILLLAFILGGLGWTVALFLRSIPQNMMMIYLIEQMGYPIEDFMKMSASEQQLILKEVSTTWEMIFIASVLSALFEESFRFLFMRYFSSTRKNIHAAFTFGMGWGIGEAFLIYYLPVASRLSVDERITILDVLPGGWERIVAIVFHVSMTLMLFGAAREFLEQDKITSTTMMKKMMLLAMGFHFLLNFIALTELKLFAGLDEITRTILIEGTITIYVGIVVVFVWYLYKRYFV